LKHEISKFFLLLWVIVALLDLDPDSESGYGSNDLIESNPIQIGNAGKCTFKNIEQENLKATDEKSRSGARSVSQRYGSADTDPYQKVTDPQQRFF
jgi:hypothetical protein